jgi:hypothetical protein
MGPVDLFCYFCLVKNHKIANFSTSTEAEEKIIPDLDSLELKKNI